MLFQVCGKGPQYNSDHTVLHHVTDEDIPTPDLHAHEKILGYF